jgi:hypothetical protein
VASRRGTSLPEVLTALTLGLFLLHLGWSTLRSLDAFERRARVRGDAVLSARVVRSVLRRELAHGVSGRDWWPTPDSLSLRAFRGVGVVCGPVPDTATVLPVAWSGERLPEPAKDSVELVGTDGSVLHVDLLGVVTWSEPCPRASPGETPMGWITTLPGLENPVAARVYERGSYHLTEAAFRYRLGAGGRQPLTPEVWDDGRTEWRLDDSTAAVLLWPRERVSGGVQVPWGGFLARRGGT